MRHNRQLQAATELETFPLRWMDHEMIFKLTRLFKLHFVPGLGFLVNWLTTSAGDFFFIAGIQKSECWQTCCDTSYQPGVILFGACWRLDADKDSDWHGEVQLLWKRSNAIKQAARGRILSFREAEPFDQRNATSQCALYSKLSVITFHHFELT